jgi:hypothetical protein
MTNQDFAPLPTYKETMIANQSYVNVTYHDVTSTALPERSNNIHQQENG